VFINVTGLICLFSLFRWNFVILRLVKVIFLGIISSKCHLYKERIDYVIYITKKILDHITCSLAKGYDSPHIIFTLGCASYNFVIPMHYHLQNFVCYLPYNDTIFSQSTQSFHFTSCQNMYKCLPKNSCIYISYRERFSLFRWNFVILRLW
jgi:hypothetical protein